LSGRPAPSPQPPGSTFRRLWIYLLQMFPPALMIPYGFASFYSLYLALQAGSGATTLVVTGRSLAGACTLVLFMLLLRVYDELKDAAGDLRLAAAGDPRYVHRPLATGRVLLQDIVRLRWVVTVLLCGINLPLGCPWPLVGFVGYFLLTWCSLNWYFSPRIQQSLLLAFLTHNPLALVGALYVLTVHLADHGPAGLGWWMLPLLLACWLPLAAWEVGRKVRVPAAETVYPTYSQALGLRPAALFPGLAGLLAAGLLVGLGARWHLGWGFLALLTLPALLLLGRSLLAALAPTPARTRLEPYAMLLAALTPLALIGALVVARGLSWR